MENNNKKTLILSIVGILVLVIAVVGVSFAMYSFSGTGQKTNVITAGSVSVNFDSNDNSFAVSNKYPMTDAKGMAQTDSKADFTVVGNWGTQTMTVNYEIGITDIVAGATLTENYVKVALKKGEAFVVGNAAGGVTIDSIATEVGGAGLLDSYVLTSGTLTTSGTGDTYTIMAYVADTYELPTDAANTTDTDTLHKKTTDSETFKFKVTVAATQA